MSGYHKKDFMYAKSDFIDTSEERVRADDMRPEAIRLADTLPRAMPFLEGAVWGQRAAEELRRLHEENQQYSEMCANQARSLFEMHKTQEELVEALEDLLCQAEYADEDTVWKLERAAAVLAKAKGESNE